MGILTILAAGGKHIIVTWIERWIAFEVLDFDGYPTGVGRRVAVKISSVYVPPSVAVFKLEEFGNVDEETKDKDEDEDAFGLGLGAQTRVVDRLKWLTDGQIPLHRQAYRVPAM